MILLRRVVIIFIAQFLFVFCEVDSENGNQDKNSQAAPVKNHTGHGVINSTTIPAGAKHDPKTIALMNLGKCKLLCSCSNLKYCTPVQSPTKESLFNKTPSVVIMSNGKTLGRHWQWNRISAVISEGPYSDMHKENWNLLCYAHSLSKHYGYVEKVTNEGQFDDYDKLTDFLVNGMNHLTCSFNSLLALEFLDLFKNPGANFTVEKFGYLLRSFKLTQHAKSNMMSRLKLYCIVPWTPCPRGFSTADCLDLIDNLRLNCDHLVLTPDSFSFEDSDCAAKPEVPMVKLVLGVERYIVRGVQPRQIIVGVPWHGYDHTCATYDEKTHTCKYNQGTHRENHLCAVTQPVYQSLGDLSLHNHISINPNMRWSSAYEAPFYTYKDDEGKTHQVWYEDWRSLSKKYEFVRLFEMGGVCILYGDDLLFNETNPHVKVFDNSMWNYLVSGLYYNRRTTHCSDYAGKIAGTAIACLLFGAFIAFLFVYIGCVRNRRFTLRPPFRKDVEQFVDEPDM